MLIETVNRLSQGQEIFTLLNIELSFLCLWKNEGQLYDHLLSLCESIMNI